MKLQTSPLQKLMTEADPGFSFIEVLVSLAILVLLVQVLGSTALTVLRAEDQAALQRNLSLLCRDISTAEHLSLPLEKIQFNPGAPIESASDSFGDTNRLWKVYQVSGGDLSMAFRSRMTVPAK